MGVDHGAFDADYRFVTSWAFSPMVLASCRIIFAIYCWTDLIIFFVYDGISNKAIGPDFSFFTNLTWWGITTYFTISAIHTFTYALKGDSWLHNWPRPLQVLHSLFYSTIVTYPILVTIVYWAILFSGPWFSDDWNAFRNVSRHATNSAAALFEIIVPATNPPPWLHIPFLVIILAMYLGLAYVTHVTQGFYPYSFLDPTNGAGQLAGYIVGIAAASAIIFVIVWFLIWLRRRFTGTGKRSKRDAHGGIYNYDVEMTRK